MTPQERIKADAEAYASGIGDFSRKMGALFGYIAGATVVHERAQLLVKTLKQVEYHLLLAKNKPNNTDYKGLVEHLSKAVTETLEQWKGKEPDRPCHHCGKELSHDRNLCCRECGKEVEK